MIYNLAKNDPVQATGYFVAADGSYDGADLVPCSHDPDGPPLVQFLAVYIATGSYDEGTP